MVRGCQQVIQPGISKIIRNLTFRNFGKHHQHHQQQQHHVPLLDQSWWRCGCNGSRALRTACWPLQCLVKPEIKDQEWRSALIHCSLPPPPPLTLPPDLLINILVGLQMASLGQGRTQSGSLSYSPHFFHCHRLSFLFICTFLLQSSTSRLSHFIFFTRRRCSSRSPSLCPVFSLYSPSSVSFSPSALSPLESAC